MGRRGRRVPVGGIDPTPHHHPDLPRSGIQEERHFGIDLFRERQQLTHRLPVTLLIDEEEMISSYLAPSRETGLALIGTRPCGNARRAEQAEYSDQKPNPAAGGNAGSPGIQGFHPFRMRCPAVHSAVSSRHYTLGAAGGKAVFSSPVLDPSHPSRDLLMYMLPMGRATMKAVLSLGLFVLAPLLLWGQYFERNKVQYGTFDFSVLKTDHFQIYHYPEGLKPFGCRTNA